MKGITGARYGRLTAGSFAEKRGRRYFWNCTCDCGNAIAVVRDNLQNGHTKSCGCLRVENAASFKHGLIRSPEYRTWSNMKSRCLNPNAGRYERYGGRGITICDRWLYSFEHFYADMGPRPPGTTIDRLDSDGHYEPGNCRWATPLDQSRNRKGIRRVVVNDRSMSVAEAASLAGLKGSTVRARLDRGLSIKEALQP